MFGVLCLIYPMCYSLDILPPTPVSSEQESPKKNTVRTEAGLSKTPPTDPCGQVGSSLKKTCFFSIFLAFFCGFSEENIVFVLHYDLKCIFQDN